MEQYEEDMANTDSSSSRTMFCLGKQRCKRWLCDYGVNADVPCHKQHRECCYQKRECCCRNNATPEVPAMSPGDASEPHLPNIDLPPRASSRSEKRIVTNKIQECEPFDLSFPRSPRDAWNLFLIPW